MKEFVSSDTNVWFDFAEVEQLAWPFRLRYSYLISRKALTTEMVDIGSTLKNFGIEEVELGRDEWDWLVENVKKYNRLSSCDLAALAIAKTREIPILTGDGALRKAAKNEGVDVWGSLKLFDELLAQELVGARECCEALVKLRNSGTRRLPSNELDKRIEKCRRKAAS